MKLGISDNKPETHTAYIGIGSNLGDRFSYCRRSLMFLGQQNGIEVTKVSRWYESDALIGDSPSGQPPYINAAARLNTSLSPESLISVLIAMESSLGRSHPRPKGEPRTIDLDLLLYDDLVLDTPALTIPHPQMTKRMFVLAPMCDIAPQLVHPVIGRSLSQLMATLGAGPVRVESWSGGGL